MLNWRKDQEGIPVGPQSPWYRQDGPLTNGSASPNTNKNKRTNSTHAKNALNIEKKLNKVLLSVVGTTFFSNAKKRMSNKDLKCQVSENVLKIILIIFVNFGSPDVNSPVETERKRISSYSLFFICN